MYDKEEVPELQQYDRTGTPAMSYVVLFALIAVVGVIAVLAVWTSA